MLVVEVLGDLVPASTDPATRLPRPTPGGPREASRDVCAVAGNYFLYKLN